MNELRIGTRRVGIFGGSFDPVHIGHLVVAQDALERLELQEVVFIPAAVPPHKQHLQRESSDHRLNMLRVATEGDIHFSVSDMEIHRGGVSYTYDTVYDMKCLCPDSELVLIVGSDTLVDLHTWHRVDELLELCRVATLLRPDELCIDDIRKKILLAPHYTERLVEDLIEAHLVDISSTEIRMRVAEGLGIRYLVPSEVEMYIYEHGLYRG
ncbi:MAG: nicotinate-nucleotide adenylyltransferase [Pontiellaceae bacterium]|nr:nicotinate-nucleotide adenylyltransferase [Pontiellaceae bacterium]